MNKQYKKLFWGLIFISFNFTFFNINILPDFIGYILITYALTELSKVEEAYIKGKKYSEIMILFSIFKLFIPFPNFNFTISTENIAILIISNLFNIINLILYYYICKGIYNQSEKVNNIELKNICSFRWNLKFYLTCIALLISAFYINLSTYVELILMYVYILITIINILIILLVRKTMKIFNEI